MRLCYGNSLVCGGRQTQPHYAPHIQMDFVPHPALKVGKYLSIEVRPFAARIAADLSNSLPSAREEPRRGYASYGEVDKPDTVYGGRRVIFARTYGLGNAVHKNQPFAISCLGRFEHTSPLKSDSSLPWRDWCVELSVCTEEPRRGYANE